MLTLIMIKNDPNMPEAGKFVLFKHMLIAYHLLFTQIFAFIHLNVIQYRVSKNLIWLVSC